MQPVDRVAILPLADMGLEGLPEAWEAVGRFVAILPLADMGLEADMVTVGFRSDLVAILPLADMGLEEVYSQGETENNSSQSFL